MFADLAQDRRYLTGGTIFPYVWGKKNAMVGLDIAGFLANGNSSRKNLKTPKAASCIFCLNQATLSFFWLNKFGDDPYDK